MTNLSEEITFHSLFLVQLKHHASQLSSSRKGMLLPDGVSMNFLNCMHNHGQIVMPVFYRVDPSHVRKQSHSFGRHFSRLRKRFPEKMKRWKNALTEAADLSGFDSNVIRYSNFLSNS